MSSIQDVIDKIKFEIANSKPIEKLLITHELYNLAEAQGYDMQSYQRWEPFGVLSDERKAVAYCLHPVVQKFVENFR